MLMRAEYCPVFQPTICVIFENILISNLDVPIQVCLFLSTEAKP